MKRPPTLVERIKTAEREVAHLKAEVRKRGKTGQDARGHDSGRPEGQNGS